MSKKCKVEGCEGEVKTKGLCNRHYYQMKKYGKIKRTVYDSNEIILYDDYAEVVLYNKQCEEIARTLIDIEDIEKVKQYKWSLNNSGYVHHRMKQSGKRIHLHRFIMNCLDDMVVDHINHNPLDNRKCNLRICTNTENSWNSPVQTNNTSGTTGVYYSESRKKWIADISVNKKRITKGFETKEEAIKVRKQWEEEYYGKFKCEDGDINERL